MSYKILFKTYAFLCGLLSLAWSATAQPQFHCTTNNGTLAIKWFEAFQDIRQSKTAPKEIVIPETLYGMPVVSIGDRAFAGQSMASVIIPNGVTNIGNNAFEACRALTNIFIPNSVVAIGFAAFSGCHDLRRIAVPASVAEIGDVAFSSSINLEGIDVDPLNPMFRSIDGVLFDKAGAKLLYCPEAKGESYSIPDGTKIIGDNAFSSSYRLTSITMPASVQKIEWHSFVSCPALTNVTIGSGIVDIAGGSEWLPFYSSPKLRITVDPANRMYSSKDGVLFDKKQTVLMFFPGTKGGNYLVPKGVIEIKEHAFSESTGLTGVELPDSLTIIGDHAFENRDNLTNVVFGNNVRTIGMAAFASCQNLRTIVIPASVTSIGDAAFAGCANLTKATILGRDTRIGRAAFSGCSGSFTLSKGLDEHPESGPQVRITQPTNNAIIDAVCMDIYGVVDAKEIEEIEIKSAEGASARAVMKGKTFIGRNIFLNAGTNRIWVVARDRQGIVGSNSIVIVAPGTGRDVTDLPVRMRVTPSAGFSPLTVELNVDARVPGSIQEVAYDFDGDDIVDLVRKDLKAVTYTYRTNGQYFPHVTIQTSVGYFSSLPGMMAIFAGVFGLPGVPSVNVESAPVVLSEVKVANPVDVKWSADSNLYVLSGRTATLSQFDGGGKLIRSLSGIGSAPSGFDVDSTGNVYVAVTGNNQIRKFKPSSNTFEPDVSFGSGGSIGNNDFRAGSGAEEFNAPFDVMVSHDNQTIVISDSGNHRIQTCTKEGKFAQSVPLRPGRGLQQNPAGLTTDENGNYEFIIDSASGRITLTSDFMEIGASGTNGNALGQFNGATHLCATGRGLYVADAGNDRVQLFYHVHGGEMHSATPFMPRVALSKELHLRHPQGVAAVSDLIEEMFYIADTGNDRVILVKMPAETPEATWNHLVARLESGDVEGALDDFSLSSRDKYATAYKQLTKAELKATVHDMKKIKPVFIRGDEAQYHFESVVEGTTLTFPIEFVKEFGRWKVSEF